MSPNSLEADLEHRLADAGFELVELERAGDRRRPILRLRIDRPGSKPGEGVTLDDCSAVHRALLPVLDEHPDVPPDYVLEVSSPGVERPLVRPGDFRRFAGEPVLVRGRALPGGARRLEGTLLGLDEGTEGEQIRLRLPDGAEVGIPLGEITRANLRYEWKKPERPR